VGWRQARIREVLPAKPGTDFVQRLSQQLSHWDASVEAGRGKGPWSQNQYADRRQGLRQKPGGPHGVNTGSIPRFASRAVRDAPDVAYTHVE
jgi:hypothetical protein